MASAAIGSPIPPAPLGRVEGRRPRALPPRHHLGAAGPLDVALPARAASVPALLADRRAAGRAGYRRDHLVSRQRRLRSRESNSTPTPAAYTARWRVGTPRPPPSPGRSAGEGKTGHLVDNPANKRGRRPNRLRNSGHLEGGHGDAYGR
jgi:hypothetical protein